MNKENFEVGQTVWFTLAFRRDEHLMEGTVTKVGTKYVTVNHQYQFKLDNGKLKEFGGELYLSRQAHEEKMELTEAFSRIQDVFMHRVSQDAKPVTLEQARAILNILDI